MHILDKKLLKRAAPIFLFNLFFTASLGASGFDHQYSTYAAVLKKYVQNGLVQYSELKDASGDLSLHLNKVSKVDKKTFKSWNEPDQIAFLINLYNAWTLKLIINHYPVSSIKKIGTIFKGPWDQPIVRLFGQKRTLNELEHNILRVNYNEPLIHVALVCAAIGCPPLISEPYIGKTLNKQLTRQAKAFLLDKNKNRVDHQEKILYLSPIFKWYADDFENESGTVQDYILKFFPEDDSRQLLKKRYKIEYTSYDWSLNNKDSQPLE